MSANATPQTIFPLLSLPTELRQLILRNYCVSVLNFRCTLTSSGDVTHRCLNTKESNLPPALCPLLLTNKQVLSETEDVLYSLLNIHIPFDIDRSWLQRWLFTSRVAASVKRATVHVLVFG